MSVNILGTTKATYKQISEWAKTKNANECFYEFFPLLIEHANTYGVDGVVAVAQAARETGFGNFPGKAVLDASFHNTCGLKRKENGESDDPNAHQRFKDWNEGTLAHIEHLALYAGAPGFPKENPVDPKHFDYLRGKSSTVEGLTGSWAEDPAYAEGIVRLYNEILNFEVEEDEDFVISLEEEISEKNKLISELMDENECLKKKIMELTQTIQQVNRLTTL